MLAHSADGSPDLIKIYPENGRWYGRFKQGQYPFPVDEVRLLAPLFNR